MRIQWSIDTEEPPNPTEPLGSLSFEDDTGNNFSAACIYLDDWFDALLNGIEELERCSNDVDIVILSEPDPLQFVQQGNVVSLSYKGKAVFVGNLAEFKNEVRNQIRAIVGVFQQYADLAEHINWHRSTKFARTGAT